MNPEQAKKARVYVELIEKILNNGPVNECEEEIVQEAICNLDKYWQCSCKLKKQ